MGLSIKNEEAERLARELAAKTGESITQAVLHSLRERLRRIESQRNPGRLSAELIEIGRRCSELPVLDARTPDEILGYNDQGHFGSW
jgi:antitoxin VapB